MENRIFYDIDKKKIYIFNSSHSIYLYNHKDQFKNGFDAYIRGIVKDNKLYLRLFYPFDDIDEKPFSFIKGASYTILKDAQGAIIKELKKQGHNIKECFLNVSNEDLKDKLKLQYV